MRIFRPSGWRTGKPASPSARDDQGRDLLSAILYGARISIGVGIASVLLSLFVGVGLGLVSGYAGGRIDAFIMRVADHPGSVSRPS